MNLRAAQHESPFFSLSSLKVIPGSTGYLDFPGYYTEFSHSLLSESENKKSSPRGCFLCSCQIASLQFTFDFNDLVSFDDISDLDVVVAFHVKTAVHTGIDLFCVIFESLE